MNMADWMVLYTAVGVAAAVASARRHPRSLSRALGSAAVMVVLWPLWAPFVLTKPRTCPTGAPAPRSAESGSGPAAPTDGASAASGDGGAARSAVAGGRIELTLGEALAAANAAGLGELLSDADVRHILGVVHRTRARLTALEQELARLDWTPRDDSRGATEHGAPATSERARAAAERRERSLERLRRLREQDAAALDEMGELCELLRAELMLARFGRAEDLSELKGELWSRLEGLAAASSLDP